MLDLMMSKAPAASPFRDAKFEAAFRAVVRDTFFELVDVSNRVALMFEGKKVEGTLFISPVIVFVSLRLVLEVHLLEVVEVEQLGQTLRLLLKDEMVKQKTRIRLCCL
jgi:hypothetical protein